MAFVPSTRKGEESQGLTVVTGPRVEAVSQLVPWTFHSSPQECVPSHIALLQVPSPSPLPPPLPILTAVEGFSWERSGRYAFGGQHGSADDSCFKDSSALLAPLPRGSQVTHSNTFANGGDGNRGHKPNSCIPFIVCWSSFLSPSSGSSFHTSYPDSQSQPGPTCGCAGESPSPLPVLQVSLTHSLEPWLRAQTWSVRAYTYTHARTHTVHCRAHSCTSLSIKLMNNNFYSFIYSVHVY